MPRFVSGDEYPQNLFRPKVIDFSLKSTISIMLQKAR
jgi:hypothetical protein